MLSLMFCVVVPVWWLNLECCGSGSAVHRRCESFLFWLDMSRRRRRGSLASFWLWNGVMDDVLLLVDFECASVSVPISKLLQ